MTDLPAFYDDLDAVLAEAWRLAETGVRDRAGAFHAPALATLGLDGRPRARTVVLRAADRAHRILRFHCDRRSDKFAEIGAEPRVALHAYDRGLKIQVRFEGLASLHVDDAEADAAWEGSREASRVCYGASPAPGEAIPEGGAFLLPREAEEIAAGRANFCAVLVAVERLEFLYLAFAGHRRARFGWDGQGRLTAGWLAP